MTENDDYYTVRIEYKKIYGHRLWWANHPMGGEVLRCKRCNGEWAESWHIKDPCPNAPVEQHQEYELV